MPTTRKVIVHIAASADGYIARPDGGIDWLTSRPKPDDFYGMDAFVKTIDTKVIGRRTFEKSLKLGAKFTSRTIVFTRDTWQGAPPDGVEFETGDIAAFVQRLRQQRGRNIWLMGGGALISSFLEAKAIDEFVVSVVPVFIGGGIPLTARLSRDVPLELLSADRYDDGLVQLRYRVSRSGT